MKNSYNDFKLLQSIIYNVFWEAMAYFASYQMDWWRNTYCHCVALSGPEKTFIHRRDLYIDGLDAYDYEKKEKEEYRKTQDNISPFDIQYRKY